MAHLTRAIQKLYLTELPNVQKIILTNVRPYAKYVEKPEIGHGKSFRRIVHFPDTYTVKPLEVTNLAGRDPASGRVVVNGIGGGIKHKYYWIMWKREGPTDGTLQEEKVIKIMKDGCRTAHIALVAVGDQLKYILATQNMKAGDIIHTSCYIPRIPVRAKEGDAYPLGALPLGTEINCVEKYPGLGGFLIHTAGSYATIVRKATDNHVVIQMPSKRQFSLPHNCMCTVGRLSNEEHGSTPIGSAQRNRELGNRPRSGWWQRKTGKHGRKIRKPPPVRTIDNKMEQKPQTLQLTLSRFTK